MAISTLIKFARRAAYLPLVGFGLLSSAGSAAECSVLEYLENKSSAAQILVNPCVDDRNLGVGSVIRLAPGGRLWLKSIDASDSDTDYQLICRNKSAKASDINVSHVLVPWIEPSGFARCSPWLENKLACKDDVKGADVLFCALATVKKPQFAQAIQRTTSVTMRGVMGQKLLADIMPDGSEALVGALKSEIDLCRSVYQYPAALTVSWTIQASGRGVQPYVKEELADSALKECVFEVIKGFDYPVGLENIQVEQQF